MSDNKYFKLRAPYFAYTTHAPHYLYRASVAQAVLADIPRPCNRGREHAKYMATNILNTKHIHFRILLRLYSIFADKKRKKKETI